MNPRDLIAERLERYDLIGDYEDEHHRPGWRIALKMADSVLDSLRDAANGGPVVLRWDTTPCPASCFSGRVVTTIGGLTATAPCPTCGGSGVVSAVTMWGLDDGVLGFNAETGAYEPETFRLAALNTEETAE